MPENGLRLGARSFLRNLGRRAADLIGMTRRLLLQLRSRLDSSPIPKTDAVWLQLDLELIQLIVQAEARERESGVQRIAKRFERLGID